METIDLPDLMESETPQWELPDFDLPEPELSMGMPTHAIGDVMDSDDDDRSPLAMIVGGLALGATVIGLGVFSAFGMTGLALTAAGAAVATPVAAIGYADTKRRLKTGRWNSTSRGGKGNQHAAMRKIAKTQTTTARSPHGSRGSLFGRSHGGVGTRGSSPKGSHGGRSLFGKKHPTASGSGSTRTASGHGRHNPLKSNHASRVGTGHGRSGGLLGSSRNHRGTGTRGHGLFGSRTGGYNGRSHGLGSRIGHKIGKSLGLRSGNPHGTGYAGGRHRAGTHGLTGRRGSLMSALVGRPTGSHAAKSPKRPRTLTQRVARSFGNAVGVRPAWKHHMAHAKAMRAKRFHRLDEKQKARWERADVRAARRQKALKKFAKTARMSTRRFVKKARKRSRRLFRRSVAWFASVNWEAVVYAAIMRVGAAVYDTVKNIPSWLYAPKTKPDKIISGTIKSKQSTSHPSDIPVPFTLAKNNAEVNVNAPRAQPAMAAPLPLHKKIQSISVPETLRRTQVDHQYVMHPAHQKVVEVFNEAIGQWQPPDEDAFDEYETFFDSWQEMFAQMSGVVSELADRLRDETPVETAHEVFADIAAGLINMGDAGADVYGAWRDGNAADVERHENPRPNEQQLNVR